VDLKEAKGLADPKAPAKALAKVIEAELEAGRTLIPLAFGQARAVRGLMQRVGPAASAKVKSKARVKARIQQWQHPVLRGKKQKAMQKARALRRHHHHQQEKANLLKVKVHSAAPRKMFHQGLASRR
jgi:hypothetical protein